MAGTKGIHTSRRLVTAMLIALLVGSVITVSAGLDSYENLGPVPDRFGTVAPEPGQRVVYHFFEVEGGEVVTQPLPYVAFERSHPQIMLDAHGEPREVEIMGQVQADWRANLRDDVYRWGWDQTPILAIGDKESGELVGFHVHAGLVGNTWNDGPVVEGVEVLQRRSNGDGEFLLTTFAPRNNPPLEAEWIGRICGMDHALQNREMSRLSRVALFPSPMGCELPAPTIQGGMTERPFSPGYVPGLETNIRIEARDRFEAIGTQELDGINTVVFQGQPKQHRQQVVLFWFAADHPYPLQFAWQHEGHADRYTVVRAVAQQELPHSSRPAPSGPAPELVWADAPPWGIPMDGLDHPFTAEQAWQVAWERGGLREFQNDNPDWMLLQALGWVLGGDEVVVNEGTSIRPDPEFHWSFTMVGGLETARFDVVRTYCMELLPMDVPYPCVYANGQDIPRHIRASRTDLEKIPGQLPARIDQVPTGASLAGRLSAYIGSPPDAAPYEWCYKAASVRNLTRCDSEFNVGWFHLAFEPFADPLAQQAGLHIDYGQGLIGVEPDGATKLVMQLHYLGTSGVMAVPPTMPAEPSDGTSIVPAPAWSLPGLVILVGGGLLGLLLAALYYLSPLAKSGVLGLFSRVTPDAALDHPARRKLHAAIESAPGIHLQELVRVTGSGRSSIEHHLDKLVDTGLVQRRVAAGYACYFPARTDRRVIAAAPALRSATARNILGVALAHPGITAQGIAESVGVGRSTVHHHLQRLAQAGVLRQDRDGASLHWYPTDAAAKVAG